MRSDLIYDSLKPVTNRYMLCQLVSKATRKFHKPNTRIQDTMNDVLVRVGKADEQEAVLSAPVGAVAEPQRRAA
ncbi:MAG TPA: DNA-directed RNA polymerase subunit omega [Candidatus Angelobacter sp.]